MGNRAVEAAFGTTAQPVAMSCCDVLVIGAGCAGMQAAHTAAAGGARVLLIDCQDADTLEAAARRGLVLGASDSAPGWLPGHTALELLLDATGAVRGAAGVSGASESPWQIKAGAVLLAADAALLMAAEAGAELGGMEQGRGGLRIRGDTGSTTVNGLFAAGSAAWSTLAPGAGLPRGTQAHALLTGQQAGTAAANYASRHRPTRARPLKPAGCAGLRGRGHRPANPLATLAAVQAILRGLGPASPDDAAATEALERLDALWLFIGEAAPAPQGALCATRAAACRLALARWHLRSLLARRAREAAHLARECVITGGVDQIWATAGLRESLDKPARRLASPLVSLAA